MSKGDEHRLARQNVIFFISESRNYQVGTKIGPQKCPHMFFLIVGYLYSLQGMDNIRVIYGGLFSLVVVFEVIQLLERCIL